MNVKVFDCPASGEEVLRCTAHLLDIGLEDAEVIEARRELERTGRFWTGGGASPLVLLMLDR